MTPAKPSEAEVQEFLAGAPDLVPRSYVEFLSATGAVEMEVEAPDARYVLLWPLHEVLRLNAGYGLSEFAPGFFAFGSDGGGELLVFDFRSPPDVAVGEIPAVPLDPAEFRQIAPSFSEFATWLSK